MSTLSILENSYTRSFLLQMTRSMLLSWLHDSCSYFQQTLGIAWQTTDRKQRETASLDLSSANKIHKQAPMCLTT